MSTIYVQKDGQQCGPFTTEELEGQVAAGAFSPEDLVWTEGMAEWQPLGTILQTVADDDPDGNESGDETVYFNESGVLVTAEAVSWKDESIPTGTIMKVEAQIEPVRRARPVVGSILLGVLVVCLALIELPRTTAAHWALWVGALVVLIFVFLRILYRALRPARSMVVIDLPEGDERVIPAKPDVAKRLADSIEEALAEVRARLG